LTLCSLVQGMSQSLIPRHISSPDKLILLFIDVHLCTEKFKSIQKCRILSGVAHMMGIDPLIIAGYAISIVVLLMGVLYGAYKARRSRR